MRAKVITGPQQIKGKTGKVVHSVERDDGKLYTLEFADGMRVDAHQDDLEFIIGEEINKFSGQVGITLPKKSTTRLFSPPPQDRNNEYLKGLGAGPEGKKDMNKAEFLNSPAVKEFIQWIERRMVGDSFLHKFTILKWNKPFCASSLFLKTMILTSPSVVWRD